MPADLFLHFLDQELVKLAGGRRGRRDYQTLLGAIRLVVRAALMVARHTAFVPASAYYEARAARLLFDECNAFREFGYICLAARATSPTQYVANKREQYQYNRGEYPLYFVDRAERLVPISANWFTREQSATEDISLSWQEAVAAADPVLLRSLASHAGDVGALRDVPNRLGTSAFRADNVATVLGIDAHDSRSKEGLNTYITGLYLQSYMKELNATIFGHLPFLSPLSGMPASMAPLSYFGLKRFLDRIGLLRFIEYAPLEELIKVRIHESWNDFLGVCWRQAEMPESGDWHPTLVKGLRRLDLANEAEVASAAGALQRLDLLWGTHVPLSERKGPNMLTTFSSLRIFIVHGHDDKTKLEVKNYFQNTLGMPQPTILHEQASRGRVLIEKFEDEGLKADLAVVILTPDDRWTPDGGDDEKRRARQNVIFEMGYFLGVLGRKTGRVLLLYKGQLELPSDIAGIVYIDITNGVEGAGEMIRRELESVVSG